MDGERLRLLDGARAVAFERSVEKFILEMKWSADSRGARRKSFKRFCSQTSGRWAVGFHGHNPL